MRKGKCDAENKAKMCGVDPLPPGCSSCKKFKKVKYINIIYYIYNINKKGKCSGSDQTFCGKVGAQLPNGCASCKDFQKGKCGKEPQEKV